MLVLPGFVSHLRRDAELHADIAMLGEQVPLLRVDLPGLGLGDRADGLPPFEERVADRVAVLDDAGIERVVVLGRGGGGPLALLLAGLHPERVAGLVLWSTAACWSPPDGAPVEAEALSRFIRSLWGTGAVLPMLRWDAPTDRAMLAAYEQEAAAPDVAAQAVRGVLELDCQVALAVVSASTLVVREPADPLVPAGAVDALLRALPHVTLVEDDPVGAVVGFVGRLAPTEATTALRIVALVDVLDDEGERRVEEAFTGPAAATAWVASFTGRQVRAGLHAGPVPGDTAEVAARLADAAAPGELLATDALVGLGARRRARQAVGVGHRGAPAGVAHHPLSAATTASTSPSMVWLAASTSTCSPRSRAAAAVTGPMAATSGGTGAPSSR